MKVKLSKKDKQLLKKYSINIDQLLEESEIMLGKRTLAEYIHEADYCIDRVRDLWPVKMIRDEIIEVYDILQKIENKGVK